jgi:cyclophilin family peptidyl-prolyl cis-trans isomerase
MSNKNLIITILIIILLGAGAAGYFYWQQTKPLVVTSEQIEKSKSDVIAQTNQQTAQATPTPSKTMEPTDQCVRSFDEKKLAGNSGINIKNRKVEIDVKGFGKIQLDLYAEDAPKTVENFLRLADAGYYNCVTFHRVAKGFVIQGGDPTGTGRGGQSAFGSAFKDELNPETASYKAGYTKGVLAMANSGPNTNGSQFFIMLGDVPLPNAYTIFGKVSTGQEVVDKIGQVDITPQMGPTDGAPKQPVVMQSVKIIK